jgi:hypothetical protein
LVILLEVGIFAFHGLREFWKPSNVPTLAGPSRLSLA